MTGTRRWAGAAAAAAGMALVAATFAGATPARTTKRAPIIIGAAVDLTANMKPFDSPALAGAQIQAKNIARRGGPNFQIKVCNHQLKKQKECADQLIGKGAAVGLVTSVIVSPILASATTLMLATTKPTSPTLSSSTGVAFGEKTPSASA